MSKNTQYCDIIIYVVQEENMYVYGKNVALEYLNNNRKIKKIFLQNNFNEYKNTNIR